MDFAPDPVQSIASMLRSAQETIAQKKRIEREFKAKQTKQT
jgi:hypothetical protein